MSTSHEIFVKRLVENDPAREEVAAYLRSRDYEVIMEPLRVRPENSALEDYVDRGDLHVSGKHLKDTKRIEVKRRGFRFTCLKDWPYPKALVCGEQSFARAAREGDKPYAYINLNPDMTYVAVINVEATRDAWRITYLFDKGYGYKTPADYSVAPEKMQFGKFEDLESLLFHAPNCD